MLRQDLVDLKNMRSHDTPVTWCENSRNSRADSRGRVGENRAECLVYHMHVTEPTTNEAQACQGAAGRIGSGLERGGEWVGRGEPEGVPGKHQPPPPTK